MPSCLTFSSEELAPKLAVMGSCLYITGLAFPVWSMLPLIALVSSGLIVICFCRANLPSGRVPLLFPVLLFWCATELSILWSEDMRRSLRLTAPFLPGLLLFFVISDYFRDARQMRLLYRTFSFIGFGLSLEVLWTAWQKGFAIPEGWRSWISDLQSPLLVVPNDTVLLALIAPLSLALLRCETRNQRKILPLASIVLSILAVCVIQSRIAIVTIMISIASGAALLMPRLAVGSSLVVFWIALLTDASLGFRLRDKFRLLWNDGRSPIWDGRFPIWSAAWANFVRSPILGHGPRTFDYLSPASIHLRWAHNLYLETLSDQGIIGMIALGSVLYSGISVARIVNGAQVPETRFLGAGAFAALMGFCVASLFELSFLRQWTVIMFFTVLAAIAQLEWYRQITEENL